MIYLFEHQQTKEVASNFWVNLSLGPLVAQGLRHLLVQCHGNQLYNLFMLEIQCDAFYCGCSHLIFITDIRVQFFFIFPFLMKSPESTRLSLVQTACQRNKSSNFTKYFTYQMLVLFKMHYPVIVHLIICFLVVYLCIYSLVYIMFCWLSQSVIIG